MKSKIIIIGGVLMAFTAIGIIILSDSLQVEAPEEPDDRRENTVDSVLNELPTTLNVADRTIEIDTDSIGPFNTEEYSTFPIEIEMPDDTVTQREMPLSVGSIDDPFSLLRSYIEASLPDQEELDEYPDAMYQASASLHRSNENGLSIYIRIMNIPDDAVGGSETRIDLTPSSGSWELSWIGERTFCRRSGQDVWRPSESLCP